MAVLSKQRDYGGNEIRGERASAEQTDPDQGEADRTMGQAQHHKTSGCTSSGQRLCRRDHMTQGLFPQEVVGMTTVLERPRFLKFGADLGG